MASTGKTRNLVNSIVKHFQSACLTEGYTRLSFATGDPEDKMMVFPKEYNKLNTAERRDAIRVPCFVINVVSMRDGRDFGIGEAETWVEIPCAVDLYMETDGSAHSLADFIVEELEDNVITWYDYSGGPNVSASDELGTIDFENIMARFPKVLNNPNKAMKHWANITFLAKVSRAKS